MFRAEKTRELACQPKGPPRAEAWLMKGGLLRGTEEGSVVRAWGRVAQRGRRPGVCPGGPVSGWSP